MVRAIGSVDRGRRNVEAELAQAAYFLKKKSMGDSRVAAEQIAKAASALRWLVLSSIHVLINLCAGLGQAYVFSRHDAFRMSLPPLGDEMPR
jgi:hypothetical protein